MSLGILICLEQSFSVSTLSHPSLSVSFTVYFGCCPSCWRFPSNAMCLLGGPLTLKFDALDGYLGALMGGFMPVCLDWDVSLRDTQPLVSIDLFSQAGKTEISFSGV